MFWSPIETVRHAPCTPTGAAAAAPNRTSGRRRGPPVTAAPHSGLMEEAGGPCSVLRAPGPRRRAAAQRPPPRLPSAYGRSPLSPASPARPLALPRRSGAVAGHSGPPRPGGPGRDCPPAGWRRPLALAESSLGWQAGGWAATTSPRCLDERRPGQQAAPLTAAFGGRAKGWPGETLTGQLRPPRWFLRRKVRD